MGGLRGCCWGGYVGVEVVHVGVGLVHVGVRVVYVGIEWL